MTIYVDELTSDGERDELIGIVKAKGQNGLVDAMENMKDPFAPVCQVKFNKRGQLELENYGQTPCRWANLYRQK